MRPRYLLIIPHGEKLDWSATQLSEITGLQIVYGLHSIIALTSPACGCRPIAGGGGVMGTLFSRDAPAAVVPSGGPSGMALAIDGENTLLKHFWGGYVSATVQGNATSVMRDPSGALPCYWTRSRTATVLASDIDLLLTSGAIRPAIDWEALARLLYWDGLPVAETILTGVRELLPGFALVVRDGEASPSPRWSPWDHAAPDHSGEIEVKIDRLRQTVRDCVSAWASVHSRLLVSVSGGLDSSIMAACLTAAEIDANCLTMYTDDPAGDERGYARSLCDRVGLRLFERYFALDAIDVTRPLGEHLPRPIGRAQDQAYEDAHLQLAREEGANAFFTGNGGDNVFGYSQSAAAIADRALHEGLTLGVAATIRDVCAHAGCGPLSAVRAAVRIAGRRSYRWRANPTFLDPMLCEAMERQFIGHPWLDAPTGALPGKAAHIAALLRVQMNLEPGRSRHAPVVHPLLSQPIVELCLAIQSWEWRSGGRDRALARDAFAGALPREIVTRRTKGSPDQFCSAIIRQNRDLIRERLMDGRLAEWRILHRPAIETALRADRMTRGDENVRLLQLVNVEAWLEAWSTRAQIVRDCRAMPVPGAVRPNI